ncbi:ankyrin [Penicillium waksmanii]|uniref:ankyrin n=1 Tax=Penicillium waksmanii TaxID=69791 RepID=UPI002546AA2F|nr:ankyrin [Penicillium waksmanii]KAJ5975297.1 ankyrin [Penicillium waksmanii]
MTDFTTLPERVLHMILSYLDGYYRCVDLCALSQVNRRFYAIASKELDHHLRRILRTVSREWPFEDGPDRIELTALAWAAENGKEDSVRRLLKAKMPVHLDKFHDRPIDTAIEDGHANIMKAFIDYGEDNGIIADHKRIQSLLTDAIYLGHESVVRLLIDNGPRLDPEAFSGSQPLSLATEKGHVSVVKLLLDNGCDPLTPNGISWDRRPSSAWTVAVSSNLEILQMFIANLNGVEAIFPGPLSGVSDGEEVDEEVAPAAWPLGAALAHDKIELVKFLYDHSPEFKVPSPSCSGSVHCYMKPGNYYFDVSRAIGEYPQALDFLLESLDLDAAIDGKDLLPIESLMKGAANGGNECTMKLMLESCLHIAVEHGHINIVNMLLDYGVKPGVNPLEEAISKGYIDMLKLMFDRVTDPAPDEDVDLLSFAVSEIFPYFESISTPGNMSIIRLLAERDKPEPDLEMKPEPWFIYVMADLANLPTELVPIVLANLNGYHRSTDLCALSQTNRRFYAIVTEELSRHLRDVFPPNIDDFEYTVLRKCAQHGKEECVKKLLRAGIRELISPADFFQIHPINMAARMGHANLVKNVFHH